MGHAKNSIGNGVAKELICMTHGHELRRGIAGGNGGDWVDAGKGGKIVTMVIAKSIKYIFEKENKGERIVLNHRLANVFCKEPGRKFLGSMSCTVLLQPLNCCHKHR